MRLAIILARSYEFTKCAVRNSYAKMTDLDVEKVNLHVPALEELANVLQKGLKKHFADVSVKVVDCPDLRKEPFTLVAEGICGHPRVLDVGGVPNLMPLVNREKIFNLDNLAKLAQLPGAFLIGAGAGPFHTVGVNSEFMANVRTLDSAEPVNGSYVATVNTKDNSCKLEKIPENCRDCALMVNLLATEGKPGKVMRIGCELVAGNGELVQLAAELQDKVLEVKAERRIGSDGFVDAMRFVLKDHYGDKIVGVGGTFAILDGKARMHVMPDFSKEPLPTPADVDNWLNFYDMSAPLVCMGVYYSHDPGYDLRIEHFHGFSHHGEGGHYHEDTTPETVRYLGYFNVAELLYRIGRPKTS